VPRGFAAAAGAGLTRKAVRVYEPKGLVRPADRSAAGYRLYTPDDIDVLAFIRRAPLPHCASP